MKLPKKLRLAMKQYYENRKMQDQKKWDKQADLQNIIDALPKNCTYFQACAGTFWITWKRPRIQTQHNEQNYWRCKLLSRKQNGEWVKVTRKSSKSRG
jgi:hypothetical protein